MKPPTLTLVLALVVAAGTAAGERDDPRLVEAIAVVRRAGLMVDDPEEASFAGGRRVTRLELARVLERVARLPSLRGRVGPTDGGPGGYEAADLPADPTDAAAVRAAVRRGFLVLDNGYFHPSYPVFRSQLARALASVLARAGVAVGARPGDPLPVDVGPDPAQRAAVAQVLAAGVMEAFGEYFHSNGAVLRADLAAALRRLLAALGEAEDARLVDPSPATVPSTFQPPPLTEKQRETMGKAVKKYGGAARVPQSSVGWMARTYDRPLAQVRRELAAAEAELAQGSWMSPGWTPAGGPDLEAVAGPPGEPAWLRNRRDEAVVLRVGPGLAMDRDEVTVARYARFLAASPEVSPPPSWAAQRARPAMPVRDVTFADAVAYAAWAGGRVPTSAEWSRAAGPGRYPWGDGLPPGTPPKATWFEEFRARIHELESGWRGPGEEWRWEADPDYQIAWLVQTRRIPPPINLEWFGHGETAWLDLAGPSRPMFGEHPDSARVREPGSFPPDVGPFGHRDLGGNVREWVVDPQGLPHVRGGAPLQNPDQVLGEGPSGIDGGLRRETLGFRLAYDG